MGVPLYLITVLLLVSTQAVDRLGQTEELEATEARLVSLRHDHPSSCGWCRGGWPSGEATRRRRSSSSTPGAHVTHHVTRGHKTE